MNRYVLLVIGFVGGVAGGGLSYWLAAALPLALATAIAAGVGVSLTVRHHVLMQERFGSPSGQLDSPAKWSGAFGGLITLVLFLGVGPTLPVPIRLGAAIAAFAFGAMLMAWNLGVGLVLAHVRVEDTVGPSAAVDGVGAVE